MQREENRKTLAEKLAPEDRKRLLRWYSPQIYTSKWPPKAV